MDSIPPPAAEARGRKQVRPHPDFPPNRRKSADMFRTHVNGPTELPHDSYVHPETLDDEKDRMQLQVGSGRSSKAASKLFSIRCILSSLKRAIIASKLISKRDTLKPHPNPGSLRLGFPREQVKAQLQAQVQRHLVVATVVLPPPCIIHILSYLSPENICRAAAVNHAWAAAAASDAVWTGKLPPHHRALVAVPLPARTMGEGDDEEEEEEEEEEEGTGVEICESSKQRFFHLAEGVVTAKGQQQVALDPCSGAFRISFSVAMTMGVFVPHNPESWTYDVAARGSPFQKIAELHPYSFYMLGGPISCQLPPGRYSVAWRLSRCQGVEQIHSNQSCPSVCSSFIDASGPLGPPLNLGWQDGVLESRITGHSASGKSQQVTRMPIAESNVLQVPMWSEVMVAEIEVKAVEGEFLCPLELTVEVNEVQGRSWVGRLFVDSMVLRQLE